MFSLIAFVGLLYLSVYRVSPTLPARVIDAQSFIPIMEEIRESSILGVDIIPVGIGFNPPLN